MRFCAALLAALALALAAAAQAPVSCRDQAWALAAQGHFRTAANALALCADAALAPEQNTADLTLLAHLSQATNALEHSNWPAASAAMQTLAAAAPRTLPRALDATLAPAFVRYGAGAPVDAATLARAPARLHAPAALPFQAFLRHQYTATLWRRFTPAAVALFLIVLLLSLAFGLRRTLRAA